MQTTRISALAGFALVALSRPALADVDAFGAKLPNVTRYTVGLELPIPLVIASRGGSGSGSSFVTSGALDARVHFGHHGFLLGVGFVPRSDAPPVGFFDLAYSFADFSSRKLRGLTGAFSVDVGPSFAFVGSTYAAASAQNPTTLSPVLDVASHATIGGRISAHADLLVGPVMLGLVIGYRGGVPTNASPRDDWEGIFFFAFEAGAAFVR